jgi:hypothetical protein
MTEAVAAGGFGLNSIADKALKASGVFWFAVALIGQWAFFYYIIAFYGASTLSGSLEVWNRLAAINGGRSTYVVGDTVGNLTFGAHALAAGIVAFGGALQLVPQIRSRFPTFHRWNGRLFLLTVIGLSLSGFYLVWVRNQGLDDANPGDLLGNLSITLNGVLILTFAALALRFAIARNIAVHRRWAMRLYLVSNAQWFLRVGMFAYFVVNMGLGNEAGMSATFFSFWTVGCYLVPLAVLQLYFLAKDQGGPLARFAAAGGLLVLTLLMGAGIFVFAMFSRAMITGAPLALPG